MTDKIETKPETQTLDEFIEACGSEEKAAAKIGVTYSTVSRWRNGHRKPKGLSAEKLKKMRIVIE